MCSSKQCLKRLYFYSKQIFIITSKRYDVLEQHFMSKTWSSKSESTSTDSKNPILREIGMLTL